jgi:hypothetical protein
MVPRRADVGPLGGLVEPGRQVGLGAGRGSVASTYNRSHGNAVRIHAIVTSERPFRKSHFVMQREAWD